MELFINRHILWWTQSTDSFILTRKPDHTTPFHFGLKFTEFRGPRMLTMPHLLLQIEKANLCRDSKQSFTNFLLENFKKAYKKQESFGTSVPNYI